MTRLFDTSFKEPTALMEEEPLPPLERNELFLDNLWALSDYFAHIYEAFMAAGPREPQQEDNDFTDRCAA